MRLGFEVVEWGRILFGRVKTSEKRCKVEEKDSH
jgi:hypothetical protein